MGKIILEFDSFEEKTEAQNALDGGSWKALVNEFDQELRAVTKYGGSLIDPKNEASEIEIDVCDKLREILRDKLNEWKIMIGIVVVKTTSDCGCWTENNKK